MSLGDEDSFHFGPWIINKLMRPKAKSYRIVFFQFVKSAHKCLTALLGLLDKGMDNILAMLTQCRLSGFTHPSSYYEGCLTINLP